MVRFKVTAISIHTSVSVPVRQVLPLSAIKGTPYESVPYGKAFFEIDGSFQSYGYFRLHEVGHFVTSVSMHKRLRAFWRDGIEDEVICEVCTDCCSKA